MPTSYWQRFQRQRISRRRLLAATGAGAAGLAIVTACGDGGGGEATPGATGTEAAGAPKRGGIYRYAITGDWGTIDPITSVAFGPGILARMYNALVIRSTRKPSEVYYDLTAERGLEQPDEQTFIFTIRPGVKIAPNDLGIPERDLDATDCKVWLETITQADQAVHKRFTDQWLDTFDAPSAREFRLTTKGPYAYFFFTLNVPVGGTIPPKEILLNDNIDRKSQAAGAGPFVLRPGSFVETGGATLDRNPNYYRTDPNNNNAQLPYVDGIVASRITDRQPRRTAFISGQIDDYDPETRREVEQLQSQIPDLQLFESPANTFISVTMNPTRSPWDNEQVRKAMNLALNRQQYVDVVFEGDAQVNGLVHWPLGDYALPPDELEQLQPYDPEGAKELIRQAGYELPLEINVIYPANSDIESHNKHLPIFLQQMEAAGFRVKEEPLDFTTWLARYQSVDYETSLSLNQIYETPEVPLDFHSAEGPTSDGNYAIGIGKLYPEVEEAIKASKSTADPEENVRLVQEAQRLIYSKGPAFLPLVSWIDFVVRHPYVKNWPRGLGTAFELYQNDWWLDK